MVSVYRITINILCLSVTINIGLLTIMKNTILFTFNRGLGSSVQVLFVDNILF